MLLGLASSLDIVDMNTVMRQLNALQPSADASTLMIQKGLEALDQADDAASHAAATAGEQQKRDTIRAHLEYYSSGRGDLTSGFYDIRNWTIQAFVAFNAVAEVSQLSIFWPSVLEALQQLPQTLGQAVGGVVGGVASGVAQGGLEAVLATIKGALSTPGGMIAVAIGVYLLYAKYGKGRASAA